MSAVTRVKRISTTDIMARKGADEPIASLTVYTAPMAALIDPHMDFVLVGDSLGMTIYGMDNTIGVTLDMMIAHGQAVMRATKRTCVVVDLPFGVYQESPEAAFRAAARVMTETGCSAIKLEGGAEMAETVAFLVERAVPVMGHIGLTPQHVQRFGGFKAQGRTPEAAKQVLADAEAISEAGAFAVVVEAVPEETSALITETIAAPTIGIGAGAKCDGQILVFDDVIGTFAEFTPRFVRRYAEVGATIGSAVADYAKDVRAHTFPGPEHAFKPLKTG